MASDIKIIEGDIWKGCYFIFFNSPRTKKMLLNGLIHISALGLLTIFHGYYKPHSSTCIYDIVRSNCTF